MRDSSGGRNSVSQPFWDCLRGELPAHMGALAFGKKRANSLFALAMAGLVSLKHFPH
jgi:hypothetical protein